MRRLMWFTLGFALSCGLRAYGLSAGFLIPLVLLPICWTASRRWKVLRPGVLLAFGCTLGAVWFALFSHWYLNPVTQLDGQTVEAQIQITDYSTETNYGCVSDGIVILDGKSYQVRVYANEEAVLVPGDLLTGQFRFGLNTPGAEEEIRYYSGKGIFLMAYQRGQLQYGRSESEHWRCKSSELRQSIRNILADTFPERTLGFVQALLIGDSSLLDYETEIAFQTAGIRHVIAVSGLHVSILFALISMVTVKQRYLKVLLGIPVLAVFAAAAGFSPSVNRACLMCGLMMVSQLADQEYDGPTALSFAALAMMVVNPSVITSVSFQLSVCSVAGIFLFYEPLNTYFLNKLRPGKGKSLQATLKKWFSGSISMSISATVLTTPMCAWYFGMVSLIGILTNLLVLWLIMPVFCGIIGVCGLFFFWKAGAVLLAKLVSLPVVAILWLTQQLAAFPLAAVYMSGIYIVIWLILAYVLTGIWLLRRKGSPLIPASCIVMLLCVALLLSWYVPGNAGCSVTMLDVGQGQCIILQSEGRTFLVDCGGDYDEITADLAARTLLGQGVETLDGVILTHYDRDHMGGLPYLLTRVGADCLILPDTEDQGKRQLLPDLAGPVLLAEDTVTVEFGKTKLTVFGPVYSGYSNENSLCILFETENCDILITGDRSVFGERMLLRQYELPDVDILVAGHHGSGYSTSEELLDAVAPETVLISVSAENNYGHPDSGLLQRLEERGCNVYRTDLCGTITIRR